MSNRTTAAYKSVFEFIHENLFPLNGKAIITDFELALRNGLRAVAPGTDLLGCWFHHCDALRRKVASICDLFALIRSDMAAKLLFRKFQCLALLPPSKIEAAFNQLGYEALRKYPAFEKFVTYYMQQWLQKEGPENYSVFLKVNKSINALNHWSMFELFLFCFS